MSASRITLPTLPIICLALVMLAVDVGAQSSRSRGRGIWGDWKVKMEFDGRSFESILSFTRDRESNSWKGVWISYWGVGELKNVQYQEGKLSFVRERRNREGETQTSKFEGRIEDGKLSGTLSGERGERQIEGERAPRVHRATGSWEVKFKVGEREITNTLVVKAGQERQLLVDWQSDRVEHKISDVTYERGKLSFKSHAKMGDREWDSTFEGTLQGNNLSGTLKSDRGEVALEGTRIGAPVIGTWDLEVSGEWGTRKQRLRIHPDLSALFGSLPVEKVELKDGQLSFKVVLEFGEQKFEMEVKGKVEESKFAGEMVTSRGTAKITGTKVVRAPRRSRSRG